VNLVAGLLALAVVIQADAPATSPPLASQRPQVPKDRRAASTAALEDLWTEASRAGQAGDLEGAGLGMKEIRRLRTERNITNHETIGLGLVARGVDLLDHDAPDDAETAFRRAVDLAPGLPDGHYGLSMTHLKSGPLGVVPSIQAMSRGLLEFLPTARGQVRSTELGIVVGLLAAFLITWVVAPALLLRHGGLLRHDIEEWLGPAQSRAASLALFLLLLLLPLAAFQGWGWLAPWWLAVLFPYFSRSEKAVSILALVGIVAVGPGLAALEQRVVTARNPLYIAAIAAVDGQPDGRQSRLLEAALRADPEDRDLAYLLAASWRRSGRLADAAALYRRLLNADLSDTVARNNLANIEFAGGDYGAALVRYRQGAEAGDRPEIAATSFYNLSLAHLEKFEYQAYNEAKSSADRLAPARVASYDRWRFDSGDYAVVDLGLTVDDVWRKFAGVAEGVGERNVIGKGRPGGLGVSPMSFVNRFTGAAALLALVAAFIGWARGSKAFTVHCSRCGTAFCRQCHLGKVVGDLCSQCYHLFVVRDGVSGPVRNRKMLEIQGKDTRRARIFRVLSVLSPGAGHIYSRQTIVGFPLVAIWYGLFALLVGGRIVPLTEVSGRLTPPWMAILIGVLLVGTWVLANRVAPDFDVMLPKKRKTRRVRAGQGG
jgi:Tfp pilus assembly protein PilF